MGKNLPKSQTCPSRSEKSWFLPLEQNIEQSMKSVHTSAWQRPLASLIIDAMKTDKKLHDLVNDYSAAFDIGIELGERPGSLNEVNGKRAVENLDGKDSFRMNAEDRPL
jgi:hypothetical protein